MLFSHPARNGDVAAGEALHTHTVLGTPKQCLFHCVSQRSAAFHPSFPLPIVAGLCLLQDLGLPSPRWVQQLSSLHALLLLEYFTCTCFCATNCVYICVT